MIVNCPTCKKQVEWSDKFPFRPFCCKRCKLIDLGAWADGSYTLSDNQAIDPDSYLEHDEQNDHDQNSSDPTQN